MEGALELVDDEGGQGFALDLLGHDDERLAHAGDVLEQGQEVLQVADLLLVEEDEGLLEDALHPVGVGDEVGRQVAAVELHALDDLQRRLQALGLLDRDDAVLADLVHGLGDDLADGLVVVGRDGADLGDHLAADLAAQLLELADDRLDGLVDALLDHGRVGAGRDVAQALAVDGLGQDRGRRRAVAGDVRRLGRDFLDQLGAHVLPGGP